jgi:hypothetical protein
MNMFRHCSHAWARSVALLCLATGLVTATPVRAIDDDDVAANIKSCFEGPAAQAAAKGKGDDDLSRSLAEMAAGKLCEKPATEIIHACLAEVDAADEGAKDYYPCIGIVANPCIDSAWASSEFREVVCAGTEEQVWLDILHENLDKLHGTLEGERQQRLEAMEKGFFAFRNDECGLVRMLREGKEPDLAYGACTTEAAARFAIDLRDMMDAVTSGDKAAGTTAPEDGKDTEAAPVKPEKTPGVDAASAELGGKATPVKADGAAGQSAYLQRLRCPDGTAPSFERRGSMGYGGYGHMVDLYRLVCEQTGQSHDVHMDMYFPGYVETQPVAGFTLADE